MPPATRRLQVSFPYKPYFLVRVKDGTEAECEQYLRRRFEGTISEVLQVEKEDLDLKNHLLGLKQIYLKLTFLNTQDMMTVRKKIQPIVNKNQAKAESTFVDSAFAPGAGNGAAKSSRNIRDVDEMFEDLREFDVPYHMRVAIDAEINCAKWFECYCNQGAQPVLTPRPDLLDQPDAVVFAWDIETTKLPLKFPDAESDQIMMVSLDLGLDFELFGAVLCPHTTPHTPCVLLCVASVVMAWVC